MIKVSLFEKKLSYHLFILKKYVLLHSLTTRELIGLFLLFNGVMVAQQILVLLVQVRALVEQQKSLSFF